MKYLLLAFTMAAILRSPLTAVAALDALKATGGGQTSHLKILFGGHYGNWAQIFIQYEDGQFTKIGDALVASLVVIADIPIKSKVIRIARARALPPGTVVAIEGSVTVPSGAFKSSISDEGFALQDVTGGIYVRTVENFGLRVRRRVRVTGKLAESNGLLVIVPANAGSIEARGWGPGVRPQTLSTGKINETTEGRLVRVTGTMTRPVGGDPPYGFRFFINDGTGEIQVFVSASTGINQQGLRPGVRVRVTGFSGQYNDHYEIEPRSQADIDLIP